jgi:hypothetical protein
MMFGYVKIGIEPSKIGISSTRIGVWPKIGMERPIWRLNLQAEDPGISPNTWYVTREKHAISPSEIALLSM